MAQHLIIEKTGVAINGAPLGTEEAPTFDVNYEAQFNKKVVAKNVEVITSDGWIPLTLASGVSAGSAAGHYGVAGLAYKVEEGHHVRVAGNIAFTAATNKVLSAPLPEQYRPKQTIHGIGFLNSYRIALPFVATDGTINMWDIFTCGSTTKFTGSVTWTDFEMDWWID